MIDHTDEAIVPDSKYSGTVATVNGDNEYDMYKIEMPAAMRLNIRIDYSSTASLTLTIYDNNYDTVDCKYGEEGDTCSFYLKEDVTYYLRVERRWNWGSEGNYTIRFFYVIEPTTVALSSTSPGKMKVSAPVGTESIDGYEIRYRLSGKKWTTKKVETTGSLNKTISGLKKGKIYTVQVRKYVENSNNE